MSDGVKDVLGGTALVLAIAWALYMLSGCATFGGPKQDCKEVIDTFALTLRPNEEVAVQPLKDGGGVLMLVNPKTKTARVRVMIQNPELAEKLKTEYPTMKWDTCRGNDDKIYEFTYDTVHVESSNNSQSTSL